MEGEVLVRPPCFGSIRFGIRAALKDFSVAFGPFIFMEGFVSSCCYF